MIARTWQGRSGKSSRGLGACSAGGERLSDGHARKLSEYEMRQRKVTRDHKDFDLSYWEGVPEKDLGKVRNPEENLYKVGGQALGHISFEVPVSQPSEMLPGSLGS